MDKAEIAKEIGQLEANLSNADVDIRKIEEKISSAGRKRTAGAIALPVGILGLIFLHNRWGIDAFVGVVGALTLLTGLSGQRAAKQERDAKQAELTQTRARLTELRALPVAG